MAHSTRDDRHLAPTDLAAVAAGDPLGVPDTAHLRLCTSCRDELSVYRRLVAALANPLETEELPAGLWDRIDQGLRAPAEEGSEGGSEVTPPGRGRWALAAAAGAGILLGAGGAGLLSTLGRDQPEPSGQGPASSVVARATLTPATEDGVTGHAEMTQEPGGQRVLAVELTGAPSGGYREVWLRDEAGSRLLSLGTMSGESARLGVPDGVDLERFPVLDVSQEDLDGDPSHSGLTLAQGGLADAE